MSFWLISSLLVGWVEYRVRRRELRVADSGSTTVMNQRFVPGIARKAEIELGWQVACCC